jgi:hypothetical protein
MQDWITLRGTGNTGTGILLMPEHCYLDFAGYQDLATYLEVSDYSAVTLTVQTAPLKEEGYFSTLITHTPGATGLQTVQVARWASGTPPARWIRWRVLGTGAGAWTITFRLYLNANQSSGTR